MGCFNVSCGVSSISMYADKAVLIPLVPAPYAPARGERESDEDGVGFTLIGANIISNSGPQALYYPLTLPIFGSMDSYGRLENIEKDANTRCIEKFFKMKIHDFAEAVAVGEFFEMPKGWQRYDKWLKNIAGMFVHREIWDHLAEESWDEFGKPDKHVYEDGHLTDEVLAMVGFRFEKEDEKFDKRYKRLMTRKDMPNVQIWSDETWIRLIIKGKKFDSIYDLEKLITTIEKNSEYRFPPAQLRRVKSTSKYAPLIEASLKARAQSRKEVLIYKKSLAAAKKKKDEKLIDLYTRVIERGGLSGMARGGYQNMFTLGDYMNSAAERLFDAIYGHALKEITPLLIKHRQVEKGIFSVNRLYMPSTNGYQHGNHYQSRALYAKAHAIVDAGIKEREREDAEDED